MNPDPLDVVPWHADDRRDNLATFGAVCFGLVMIVGIIVWAVLGR